eukprot:CAMPEP_0194145314 /NCGR_PEP_ID=MMETSP0152-20130528/16685_1 /TAXON_ID=1049557 /ORGANISM="Thalassiothrix antarctica, Strain L6-D1" /LENGTH=755 /DNA_ID=CAMNT_0038845491 /DNA_START=211 /DNA_END=2478 /DNA_ORIENTATION=+
MLVALSQEVDKEETWDGRKDTRPGVISINPILRKISPGIDYLKYLKHIEAPQTCQCELRRRAQSSNKSVESEDDEFEDDNEDSANVDTFDTNYFLPPDAQALGQGAFSDVFLGIEKRTGEKVAVKLIHRDFTDDESFKRELRAMQYILQYGGHPHICSLHDWFQDKDSYHVVVDFVSGGEMFDHLIKNGAYSEADAARLLREVASALAFLHGIGVIHSDLKPENIMLSTESASDSAVKLVDFGSAEIPGAEPSPSSFTPAYAPPEAFDMKGATKASADMWAVGVILYIMLIGKHPFALKGCTDDDDLENRIRTNSRPPPLRNSRVTKHVSDSAKDLLERLMERDPAKRMNAAEMLQHPWVQGKTATTDTIAGSDERLSRIRKMKTKLQADFFRNAVTWSDNEDHQRRKTSLMEESFKSQQEEDTQNNTGDTPTNSSISMAEFQGLLSENMKHKFFPKNHIIYNEGDIGNHMYILNSGIVEVTTSHGSRAERTQGDFFGEGALVNPQKIRSGTIRCKTPVHVLEVSREYFEKYLASSELDLFLAVKEKDQIRKKNRAKMILSHQNSLKYKEVKEGTALFREGKGGDTLFIVQDGVVRISVKGEHVFSASNGNICGEYAAISKRKRNSTAVCITPRCMVKVMKGQDFRKLMELYPEAKAAIRDLSLRRDFKKAVVFHIKKEFPYDNPIEAFEAVGVDKNGVLGVEAISKIMREMDPEYTNDEIQEIIRIMDLTGSGTICLDEFRKVFVADIRASASI